MEAKATLQERIEDGIKEGHPDYTGNRELLKEAIESYAEYLNAKDISIDAIVQEIENIAVETIDSMDI